MVDPEACREICPSIWDNSIFDKSKHPGCIKHYLKQIIEVEEYLKGMTLWEYFNYASQVPEHMRYLPVRVDYLHLIHPMPDIKFIDGKYIVKRFKGFHLDHGQVLERAGEISHEIIKIGPEGCFESNVIVKGLSKPESKSMFSPRCTLLDTIKLSREACCNSSEFIINSNFSLAIEGVSKTGLEIFASFGPNALLTTTHPLIR